MKVNCRGFHGIINSMLREVTDDKHVQYEIGIEVDNNTTVILRNVEESEIEFE